MSKSQSKGLAPPENAAPALQDAAQSAAPVFSITGAPAGSGFRPKPSRLQAEAEAPLG
jgi:hypothetical protein